MSYKNYHACLTATRPPGEPAIWTCDYCSHAGSLAEMRTSDCTFVYPVCEFCGGCEHSNECRPDCSGIAELLNDPSVYVAGFPEKVNN